MGWPAAGAQLEGLLVTPNDGAGPWPLVVALHGGPVNGLSLLATNLPVPLEDWCDHGLAAFAPDFRGSGIAGKQSMLAAAQALPDARGGSDLGDVLAGVDALVHEGVADPKRLFLFGHSYGGYLVNQLVTADHRFQAAVCYEGRADARLAFCLAWGGGGLDSARHLLGGSPWQAPHRYEAASPITRAHHVRTPLLLLHGDHDPAPAICWYTALREHSVDTELVFYRGEGHLAQRPANRTDILHRSLAWFHRHDAGKPTPP